ncbi:MAG: DNA polymerase IV [Treponema sp.]|nr:DNA polymerase IV [Treponema sp.]
MPPVFLHIDLDAFFASVEQLDHPEWRGKPVIVGGIPGDRRAVVSTASYEARACGVHSAMPLAEAVRRCPNGIYVRGNMRRYHELSETVMQIFRNYSPDVQQMSVDEAFVDLTGTERLFGQPEQTAMRIKDEVRTKTGLTVSVGLASTRYVAKIASGLHKPDGFCVVPRGRETEFMLSLPLAKIWGAGEKTQQRLRQAGFFTARDVYNRSLTILQSLFGKSGGTFLYNAVRGGEAESFTREVKSHSLSSENTYAFDLTDRDAIDRALLELSYTVVFRLLKQNMRSSSVSVKIRYDDFSTVSIQDSSDRDVTSTDDMFDRVKRLFWRKYESGRGIRLLGVSAQNAVDANLPHQAELFDFGEEKRRKLESAILKAKQKNPSLQITKARLLSPVQKTGSSEVGRRLSSVKDMLQETPSSQDVHALPMPRPDAHMSPNAHAPSEGHVPQEKARRAPPLPDGGTHSGFPTTILLVSLSALLLALAPSPVRASETETLTERTADGAGSIVFDTTELPLFPESDTKLLSDFSIAGNSVEFMAQGWWQSTVSANAAYSFGFGSAPAFSSPAPVITQKVDLGLWFLLNRHWYFEADFADGFETNTVAAGYTAGEGLVKEARVANRGIVFPSLYSIDKAGYSIGGSKTESQAPGFSIRLGGETWRADAVFRYDMLESKEKTWYGKNSVQTSEISLAAWYSGSRYMLPDSESLLRIRAVYVEKAGASYKDADGRQFVKLDESQYLISASSNSLYLSKDAGAARKNGKLPAVAVSFTGAVPDTAAFISATEALFQEGGIEDLAPYLQELSGTVDGNPVLYLQHPSGFSPFVWANRYDAALSNENTDAAVIFASTKNTAAGLQALYSDDSIFSTTDFFSGNRSYIDISQTTDDEEILSITDPRLRFPLAARDPGLYLGSSRTTDLVLSVRTYTSVTRFSIGTKAVPGTIRVYKNGMLDSGARFDEEKGTITLSGAVHSGDHIYATWYEDSKDADTGAITGAAGIRRAFGPHLSADIASAVRWTYGGKNEYASSSTSFPGFVSLAQGTYWQGEHLSLSNVASVALETANTTGSYRILGMDETAGDWKGLSEDAASSLPEGFYPILNPRPEKNDSMPALADGKNGSVDTETGWHDSLLPEGYSVRAGWNFSSLEAAGQTADDGSPYWAATQISLASSSGALSSSSSLTLYLKNDTEDSDFSVYLQLGIEATDDFDYETRTKIPTWCISADSVAGASTDVLSPFIPATSGWQQVTIAVRDEDRSRISLASGARLIICSTKATTGSICAGSWKASGTDFSLSAPSCMTVTQSEETTAALSSKKVKRFNSGTNYVRTISWKTRDENLSTQESLQIEGSRYFDEIDLGGYTDLSLFLKFSELFKKTLPDSFVKDLPGPTETVLNLTLDRPDENDGYETCLSISISAETVEALLQPSSSGSATESAWQELRVSIQDKSATIGSCAVSVTKADTSVIPTRLHFTLETAWEAADGNKAYFSSGCIELDELSLSGISPDVHLADTAELQWKQAGTVIETKTGNALLSDLLFEAKSSGSSTVPTAGGSPEGAFSASAKAEVTALGISLSAGLAHDADSLRILTKGSHRAETASPLWNILNFSENYSIDADAKTLSKANSAAISFDQKGFPLTLSAESTASAEKSVQSQNIKSTLAFTPGRFFLRGNVSAEQKLSKTGITSLSTASYGSGWKEITALSFNTGKEDASRRTVAISASSGIKLPLLTSKPEVQFSSQGSWKDSSSLLFSDTETIAFDFPFRVHDHSFSVNWTKKAGGTAYAKSGGNYRRDAGDLRDAACEKNWFFTAYPVYDMLSSGLSKRILKGSSDTGSNTEYAYYEGSYSASWKRSLTGTAMDLMLPAFVTATFSRSIHTASSVSDYYQIKAVTGYTALNIFGRAGTVPIARWFKQDEYSAQGSATLKIPRKQAYNLSMLYSAYLQAAFFVNRDTTFKSGLEGSWETAADWSGKMTFVWKRKGSVSPMLGLIAVFRKDYGSKAKLTRTDSINLSASSTQPSTEKSPVLSYSGNLNHQLDIAVTEMITVSSSLGGGYTCTQGKSMILQATASIGAAIRF